MTLTNKLKHTPLFNYYQKNKIKLMDFGGWAMPIQFTGIIEEHKAVRNHAGLFDVSHMGEFLVEGEDAQAYLDGLLTNDLTQIIPGQSQYHAMCEPNGGTIDDLIISMLAKNRYFITANASNTEKDFNWLQDHLIGDVQLTNLSDLVGLLALQGPNAEKILQKMTSVDLSELKAFHFIQSISLDDVDDVLISRTGYTGEDGFELYISKKNTEKLWERLLVVGEEEGLKPCGLGSRDTLRLEAGLSLYGHELSSEISPIQANIGFAVKTNTETDFIGKKPLKKQRETGVQQKIRGFELIGRGIARSECKVYSESGEEIGIVTSGTKSPTLTKSIGLALIDTEKSKIGTAIQIEIRNKLVDAIIVKTPFYKRERTK